MDMLPGESSRDDFQLLRQLGLINRIFLSFEMSGPEEDDDPAELARSMDMVGNALKGHHLFDRVTWRLGDGYQAETAQQFWESLPALLTAEDLDRIGSKLTPAGLDKVMRENIGLLAGPTGIGLQRQVQRDPFSLLPAFLQPGFT